MKQADELDHTSHTPEAISQTMATIGTLIAGLQHNTFSQSQAETIQSLLYPSYSGLQLS